LLGEKKNQKLGNGLLYIVYLEFIYKLTGKRMTDKEYIEFLKNQLEHLNRINDNITESLYILVSKLPQVNNDWVSLTENEIGELYRQGWKNNVDFATGISNLLKEKNNF
jgi:hypothetical protein